MLNGECDEETESRFEADYKLSKLLYNGTFSSVYECVYRATNQKYAVKIVDVPRFLTVYSKDQLANETKIADILLNVDDNNGQPNHNNNNQSVSPPQPHPQLVTVLDSRSEFSKYYMIYERLHHRDICFEIEHRVASLVYGEHIARHYMRQILEAVQYMHSKSVIHRDLKVSCILLGKSDQIKIGGFSAAIKLPERGYIQKNTHNQIGGTVHYMSPEVIRCELYGRPVDVWGCGVLLYVLLSGTLPFTGKTVDVYKSVLATPDFGSDKWMNVSSLAKQLCQSMLTSDQYKRITIDEALRHPWIQESIPRSSLSQTVARMSSFNARRKISSAINVAFSSSLWDHFENTCYKSRKVSPSGGGACLVHHDVVLETAHTKEVSRVVNNVIVTIQDSIEEAHILHEDPLYLNNPSVAHDQKLPSLLKLYDKIAVDLNSSFSRDALSLVSNDKGEVGAFKLCTEITSILDHQLTTSQSFTPQDSQQLRDLFQSYNFNYLLRAHDVIVAEFFGNQSNSSSPMVGGGSTSSPTTFNDHHEPFSGFHRQHHHTNNNNTQDGNCLAAPLARSVAGPISSCHSNPITSTLSCSSPSANNEMTNLNNLTSDVTRVKQVNFYRNPGEPLGITLKILKTDQVIVSRVMIGGMIHRQKILNEGDEILEINGRRIRKNFSEEALRALLNEISGDIVIKVTPNNSVTGAIQDHANSSSQSYFVRAMFDYRPEEDATSQAAATFGLSFRARDILQILKHKSLIDHSNNNSQQPHLSVSRQSLTTSPQLSSKYANQTISSAFSHTAAFPPPPTPITENQRWWQARVVCKASDPSVIVEEFDADYSNSKVGLVPSCLWRMEMIRNEKIRSADKIRSSCNFFSRRKKKMSVIELNEDEIYERVVQLKSCLPRKCLLLVGAPGVGRRSIKNALIQIDHRFAYPKPHTSKVVDEDCVDENGHSLYHHVPHSELLASASRGEYLEVGKYNDAWFGTKFDTIDRIIASQLIPVLDIEPDSIKKLRNGKYLPYVVFVDAPRIIETAKCAHDDASIVQSFDNLLHMSIEIDRHYRALFDLKVENKNIEETVEFIRNAFDEVSMSPSPWIPLNWLAENPTTDATTLDRNFSPPHTNGEDGGCGDRGANSLHPPYATTCSNNEHHHDNHTLSCYNTTTANHSANGGGGAAANSNHLSTTITTPTNNTVNVH